MTIEPEMILLVGGGIVTLGVAIFVIRLIVSARREHEEVLRREREELRRLERGEATRSDAASGGDAVAPSHDHGANRDPSAPPGSSPR
ncbi:MAG: hypothetical protein FJ253_03420 [Phycisphaerae bacterium]|nr:hypothetical protein [Phycisphaerae bacterium]